jgi:hypothetical protein
MTRGLVDEIILIDLVTLFLMVATVSILWYGVKKIFPGETRDLQFFLTYRCDRSVCNAHLFWVGDHKLRCDGLIVWLGTSVAVKGPIVAADYRFDSFLYRPNGVAMVELA